LLIDTDLLLIVTSTADGLSGGANMDNVDRPWNRKNRGFYWIFRYFSMRHTFHEWTAPKLLNTDQDNLRVKFSALNLDFNSASFDFLGSRSNQIKTRDFCYCRLASKRLQIDTDLLLTTTSTADDLCGGTDIDDHERP